MTEQVQRGALRVLMQEMALNDAAIERRKQIGYRMVLTEPGAAPLVAVS